MMPEGRGELVLDLQVKEGEFITLYGRSGAGKTTALRMLAGLVTPDWGVIKVGQETWFESDRRVNVVPQQRQIGFVFQDYALFPNMTVRENLLYALTRKEDVPFADEILAVVHLEELADRKPSSLSGGQKQRVALARALVRRPKILLLDEPLSSLDLEMRLNLQEELREVHRHYSLTSILVSHDLPEIFNLSDRVICIDRGQIQKQGPPSEVFAGERISGKFKFTGEILAMEPNDVIWVITVLVGGNLVKVVATEEEITDLRVGDRILLASKAFNPIIIKL
jgi:molybdate transport system ATP-binding protein